MVTSLRAMDEVLDVIVEFTEVDRADIDVKIFTTYQEVWDFVRGRDQVYWNQILKYAFGRYAPSLELPDEPDYSGYKDYEGHCARMKEHSEVCTKILNRALADDRDKIECHLKPIMFVKAWCSEGDDYDPIYEKLSGISVGSY